MIRRILDRLAVVVLLIPAMALTLGWVVGVLSRRQYLDYTERMFQAVGDAINAKD